MSLIFCSVLHHRHVLLHVGHRRLQLPGAPGHAQLRLLASIHLEIPQVQPPHLHLATGAQAVLSPGNLHRHLRGVAGQQKCRLGLVPARLPSHPVLVSSKNKRTLCTTQMLLITQKEPYRFFNGIHPFYQDNKLNLEKIGLVTLDP